MCNLSYINAHYVPYCYTIYTYNIVMYTTYQSIINIEHEKNDQIWYIKYGSKCGKQTIWVLLKPNVNIHPYHFSHNIDFYNPVIDKGVLLTILVNWLITIDHGLLFFFLLDVVCVGLLDTSVVKLFPDYSYLHFHVYYFRPLPYTAVI